MTWSTCPTRHVLWYCMDFYLFFPLYLFIAIYCIRVKRASIGDFVAIRWDDQPVLFLSVVFLSLLCAVDGFCGILSIFKDSLISDEDMKILDDVTVFLIFFVSLVVFVWAKKLTIKKKDYTWKEGLLVRSSFVVVSLAVTAICAERLVRGLP